MVTTTLAYIKHNIAVKPEMFVSKLENCSEKEGENFINQTIYFQRNKEENIFHASRVLLFFKTPLTCLYDKYFAAY